MEVPNEMKPKRERSPWLWLILIPIQALIVVLSFFGGSAIDAAIFSGGNGQGHGAPIFTMLLPLAALAVSVVVVVIAIIRLAVGLARRRRRRREQSK